MSEVVCTNDIIKQNELELVKIITLFFVAVTHYSFIHYTVYSLLILRKICKKNLLVTTSLESILDKIKTLFYQMNYIAVKYFI